MHLLGIILKIQIRYQTAYLQNKPVKLSLQIMRIKCNCMERVFKNDKDVSTNQGGNPLTRSGTT